MVSVQTGARFLECSVRHAAATDIYFPKGWMIPGVDHLRTTVFQYFMHGLLHHLHVIGFNIFKPVAIAFFRVDIF